MNDNYTTLNPQNLLPLYLAGVGRGSVPIDASTDHTQNQDLDHTPDLDQDPTPDQDKSKIDRNDYRTDFDPAMEYSGS